MKWKKTKGKDEGNRNTEETAERARSLARSRARARARDASLRDDSVAQSADSQVSCKCTQNRCPTGSRGRARRAMQRRAFDRPRASSCMHQWRASDACVPCNRKDDPRDARQTRRKPFAVSSSRSSSHVRSSYVRSSRRMMPSLSRAINALRDAP